MFIILRYEEVAAVGGTKGSKGEKLIFDQLLPEH
jgi:hypothetical protein